MDDQVKAILAEYEAREEAEMKLLREGGAEALARLDEFLIPIGPDTGALLNLLIRTTPCKSILEVGTSYGNSTVWLAAAARETGGRVLSLELAQHKVDYAAEMLVRAGLRDYVDFIVGDAVESIRAIRDRSFDFVLIDIWKDIYIPAFDAVYPLLTEGALVAGDNMLSPPSNSEDAKAYRRHVRAQPNIESVLLNMGSGVELSRYASSL